MFAVSLKEVDFPVEKQNLYVRNNLLKPIKVDSDIGDYIPLSSLSYVGECLINMEDHTIYKVGKRIKYTRTQDLIEQVLTEYGKFTTHHIYYSKDKSAVCINLILTNYVTTLSPEYRFALEVSNYYSGRFSPRITLSLYNIHRDVMIRTPIPAFNEHGLTNLKGLTELFDVMDSKFFPFYIYRSVLDMFPKKYEQTMPIHYQTLLEALNVVAEIASRWLETNYELATMTQRKIYDILTNKIIKEQKDENN